jgi:hypothetical protein
MVIHKHKCIFIHINKCGGTSIERFFIDGYDVPKQRTHDDINYYKKKFPKNFKKYFKFTLVRNPWDKLLSQYFYQVKNTEQREYISRKKQRMATHFRILEEEYVSFEKFLERPFLMGHKQQLKWISGPKGKVLVDHIGRFENIQEEFDFVCDKIGIERGELPHAKNTNHEHYSKYYTDETRELVGELYKDDIEYFGYSFEEEL